MKVNLLLVVVTIWSSLVSSNSKDERAQNELITKLSRTPTLGRFGKNNKAHFPNDVFPYTFESAEEYQETLGLNDRAKEKIQGFLDSTNQNTISALFLVSDDNERDIIQGLLRNAEDDQDLKEVSIFKLKNAKQIIKGLLQEGEESEEIKAVLIVRDDKAKVIIEKLLNHDAAKTDVKVVLVGQDNQAKKIIEGFLEKEKLKIQTAPEKGLGWEKEEKEKFDREKYDREKDEQAKELIRTMFYKHENQAKDMIQGLLGQDEKVKNIISSLPEGESKTKEMMKKLLGQDSKVQKILGALQVNWVNTGFLTKDEKVKDTNFFPLKEDLSKHVNEGLITLSDAGHKCSSATYKTETDVTHTLMQGLFAQLRSYIQGSKFDYQNLEREGRGLEASIVSLEARVNKVVECSPVLAQELSFAKVMFKKMVETIEILMYYEKTDFPGHMLVYYMIDLNVRLLSLRDRRGKPDPSISKYVARVKIFIQFMNYWHEEFKKYEHIMYGRSMFFQKQFEMAQSTVITLARAALVVNG